MEWGSNLHFSRCVISFLTDFCQPLSLLSSWDMRNPFFFSNFLFRFFFLSIGKGIMLHSYMGKMELTIARRKGGRRDSAISSVLVTTSLFRSSEQYENETSKSLHGPLLGPSFDAASQHSIVWRAPRAPAASLSQRRRRKKNRKRKIERQNCCPLWVWLTQ